MVEYISGVNGTGKTRTLAQAAIITAQSSKGNVIFVDDTDKLKYALPSNIRLINTEDWWTAAVQGTNGNFTTEKQISTNQYMICVSRTADTSFIMGAVAYIVYEDSQGETHTAFSEQSLISYKTA